MEYFSIFCRCHSLLTIHGCVTCVSSRALKHFVSISISIIISIRSILSLNAPFTSLAFQNKKQLTCFTAIQATTIILSIADNSLLSHTFHSLSLHIQWFHNVWSDFLPSPLFIFLTLVMLVRIVKSSRVASERESFHLFWNIQQDIVDKCSCWRLLLP